MLLLALLPAALATDAAPATTPNPDVVTERVVAATPEAMAAVLTDLARFSTALPSDCVGRFTVGVPASGKGAQARLRYDMAAMHRTLNMTVSRVDVQAGRAVVDHDHAGNRGFVSRWFMEAKEDGTHVKVTTPINAPPWPFTKYYFEAVKPEWDACQGRFVENVAMAAAAGP